jgi:ketosteroid isomerase-like protein
MTRLLSRREVLKAGVCTLAAASTVLRTSGALAQSAHEESNQTHDQLIRRYYAAYEKKDWSLIASVLAENFTFTSPNDDDHISTAIYKARCWPQAELIERFEFESIRSGENDAFVKYVCHTTKGVSFRNVEYHRFSDGRISSVECYFGGHSGYPAAAISGKS